MAFTQAQYDALKAAIASGNTEVEYDGKKLRRRSLAELREILRMMERDLGLSPANDGFVAVQYSKGLGPTAPQDRC